MINIGFCSLNPKHERQPSYKEIVIKTNINLYVAFTVWFYFQLVAVQCPNALMP